MSDIQHSGARKLLRLISSKYKKRDTITYGEAAKLMGRTPPENHSRAVAQMCDLLDAAACLADVPALALVVVREQSGEINTKAWKEDKAQRDAIIKRSSNHHFTSADFGAIAKGLTDLGQRGNIRAWRYVNSLYPGTSILHRLTGTLSHTKSDAINDLGTDEPDRAKSVVWSYARDPGVRNAVLTRANGKCEHCNELGFKKPDGSRYLECHHVIALANDGEDRVTNVIALCSNDHREAHFSERWKEIEAEMMHKLKALNP